MTEEGSELLASSFAYGTRYVARSNAIEVDPLWDPRLKGWRLSPLYDVLPRPTHAQERQLHLGVGPQGRHASIDNAIAGCGVFTLNARRAGELVAKVWSEVREWKVHFERFGVSAQDIERISPAFRHLDDVTTRATRLTLE